MINCRFEQKNGILTAMTLSGHAGYAEEGKDIVCAAISAACDLTMHLAVEYFEVSAVVFERDGISFNATDELESANKLLCGFRDYLEMVRKQYPTCINIEYTEV